jgi:hypothetical protein
MLSAEDIKNFQKLYQKSFGKELGEKDAYIQASKLIQMMKIIYKPMSKAEMELLNKRRNESDEKE